MAMNNPPHPGEFIRDVCITPFELSVRKVAEGLSVSPSTLSRLLNGESNISPEMALRLSKALGRSPESLRTLLACWVYTAEDGHSFSSADCACFHYSKFLYLGWIWMVSRLWHVW